MLAKKALAGKDFSTSVQSARHGNSTLQGPAILGVGRNIPLPPGRLAVEWTGLPHSVIDSIFLDRASLIRMLYGQKWHVFENLVLRVASYSFSMFFGSHFCRTYSMSDNVRDETWLPE